MKKKGSKNFRFRLNHLRHLIIISLFIVVSMTTYAQNNTVKGVVTDKNGNTLIGAAVIIKGTNYGTTTDSNGQFILTNVPDQGMLQVSYIGFETKSMELTGNMNVTITLNEEVTFLNEIVVVGYGTQKKSDVTGALAHISSEELITRPVDNALQALQGKAAGVDITSNERPGELGKIRIRGTRSLSATSEPLYVVDGIPLNTGGIETINPRDIESIDVLKDASSTAIYGFRGANGVILVTTKRGKAGVMQLSYSGSFTFEKIHDLSPMMSAADYITWRRWAYYNSAPNLYSRGDQPTQAQDLAFFTSADATATANIMKGWENGTWDPSKVVDTDWTKYVTQTGITQEHTVSGRGGTDKMKSSFSFGYLNNKGTQKGQTYERYNGTLSTDISATPWFAIGGSLNGSWSLQDYGYSLTGQTSSSNPNDIYSAAKSIFRYAQPYDANGDLILNPGGITGMYTVIDEWTKSIDNRQGLRLLGSFYANMDFGKIWKPLNGLTYKISFGPDYRNSRSGYYLDKNSAVRKGSSSQANVLYNREFAWTLDNQVNYEKTIKKHHFNITLLQTASKYNQETGSIYAENIPFKNFKWNNMGSVDLTNPTSMARISTGLTESQLTSYMGRINYSFKDRYLLTLSERFDGASMLGKGNKWAVFPSAALAWRISQEDFINDIGWIDQLKLRIGVGTVGNAAINPYSTLGSISGFFVPFGGNGNTQAYATNEPYYSSRLNPAENTNLGWETTTSYNYGLDFSFLRGRIGGALDIYNSYTSDLIMNMTIPTISGYNSVYTNIGKTKNFGIEATLNVIPLKISHFEWNSTFNVAYQKDEIVSLRNGKQDMLDNFWLIGQSINIYYGYVSDGLWKESDAEEMAKYPATYKFEVGKIKPVDQNLDYVIDDKDRVVQGNKDPRWTIAWSNTFSYKGIELSIELFGRLNYTVSTGGEAQTGLGNQRQIDYWTPDNQNAEWQKPIYNTSGGDFYSSLLGFKDGSFIKFRNVSLGYILPEKICKPLHISSLKLFGQLRNPGSLYSEIKFRDQDLGTSYYNRGFTMGVQVVF